MKVTVAVTQAFARESTVRAASAARRQPGGSGQTASPELCTAIANSGAIERRAGIKRAKTIFAIRKDRDAPIFAAADIGVVGYVFEATPALQPG